MRPCLKGETKKKEELSVLWDHLSVQCEDVSVLPHLSQSPSDWFHKELNSQ